MVGVSGSPPQLRNADPTETNIAKRHADNSTSLPDLVLSHFQEADSGLGAHHTAFEAVVCAVPANLTYSMHLVPTT